jgi:HlyD family secretion protein
MKLPTPLALLAACATLLASCAGSNGRTVYTGRMDADTVTLSAQGTGTIDSLAVREGDAVHKGQLLCILNTDRLEAQRRQQEAQLTGLAVSRSVAESQIRQARVQLDFTRETLAKTETLLKEGGATQQRRDELATQAKAGQDNLDALKSNVALIASQAEQIRATIALTDIQIRDAKIQSPIDGVVLNTYRLAGEFAGPGTPLLQVSDLSSLTVEIYVPLRDLPAVTIGQKATISADGEKKSFSGVVSWISSEAEFTPKTILTQETRTTLVYGVKIRVPNPDGSLKIGMPVDVRF